MRGLREEQRESVKPPFEGYERDIPRTAEKKANYMSAGRQQKARRARAAPAQNEHRLRLANIESRTARRVCTSFCAAGCRSTKSMWIKSTKLWPLTLPPTVTEDRPQIDDGCDGRLGHRSAHDDHRHARVHAQHLCTCLPKKKKRPSNRCRVTLSRLASPYPFMLQQLKSICSRPL